MVGFLSPFGTVKQITLGIHRAPTLLVEAPRKKSSDEFLLKSKGTNPNILKRTQKR